jgi:uronate dehydrogenase
VTVLITGAAGTIGRMLRTRLSQPLRLYDVVPCARARRDEQVEVMPPASVTDAAALAAACAGVDAVVHLGGIPAEDSWERILSVNVDGTRAVLEAARAAGVGRVVLASSNHAVGFVSRAEAPVDGLPADVTPRPDTYYGFSKAAMEALGSLYHSRFGMDVICLRIGTCAEEPPDDSPLSLATWLSPDDAGRLVDAALTTPAPGFRIVWGISRNTRRWWSLAEGKAIGYRPADDAERYAGPAPSAPPLPADDRIGGLFCTMPLGESYTASD